MDAKKEKVLAALLSYPTKELAAKAAGVSSKTINRYLRDAEFAAAYRRAASGSKGGRRCTMTGSKPVCAK